MNIALWEASRIWSHNTQRDVMLSLGTGTGPDATSPQKTPVRHTFRDGFISRLCRSFMTGLDGELTWRNLLNHLEKDAEHRYFRLNVQFGGQEPRLDDITAMEKLSHDVNTCKDDEQLTQIKLALLRHLLLRTKAGPSIRRFRLLHLPGRDPCPRRFHEGLHGT